MASAAPPAGGGGRGRPGVSCGARSIRLFKGDTSELAVSLTRSPIKKNEKKNVVDDGAAGLITRVTNRSVSNRAATQVDPGWNSKSCSGIPATANSIATRRQFPASSAALAMYPASAQARRRHSHPCAVAARQALLTGLTWRGSSLNPRCVGAWRASSPATPNTIPHPFTLTTQRHTPRRFALISTAAGRRLFLRSLCLPFPGTFLSFKAPILTVAKSSGIQDTGQRNDADSPGNSSLRFSSRTTAWHALFSPWHSFKASGYWQTLVMVLLTDASEDPLWMHTWLRKALLLTLAFIPWLCTRHPGTPALHSAPHIPHAN